MPGQPGTVQLGWKVFPQVRFQQKCGQSQVCVGRFYTVKDYLVIDHSATLVNLTYFQATQTALIVIPGEMIPREKQKKKNEIISFLAPRLY